MTADPRRRPPGFNALTQRHSRWTPPSYWARMLADLGPLRPAERRALIAEREAGMGELVQLLDERPAETASAKDPQN